MSDPEHAERQRRLQARRKILLEQQDINRQLLQIMDEEDKLENDPERKRPPQSQRMKTVPHTPEASFEPTSREATVAASEIKQESLDGISSRSKTPIKQESGDTEVIEIEDDSDDSRDENSRTNDATNAEPPTSAHRNKIETSAPCQKRPLDAYLRPQRSPSAGAEETDTPPKKKRNTRSRLATGPKKQAQQIAPKTPKYPRISNDEKYAMIVRVNDQVLQVACCFCGGNHYDRHGNGKPPYDAMKGVEGLCRHIDNQHSKVPFPRDSGKRDSEWVVRNCVEKILLQNEEDAVYARQYDFEVKATGDAKPELLQSR